MASNGLFTTTNDTDLHGVELAAIKSLNQTLQEESRARDAEIQQLRHTVAQLKNFVNQMVEQKKGTAQ